MKKYIYSLEKVLPHSMLKHHWLWMGGKEGKILGKSLQQKKKFC